MNNQQLEAVSIRNMVHFFRDELRQIEKGVPARNVLGAGQLRALKRNGILSIPRKSHHAELTHMGQMLLDNLERYGVGNPFQPPSSK